MFQRQDELIYADSERTSSGSFLGTLFGWVLLAIATFALVDKGVRYCIDTAFWFVQSVDGMLQSILAHWPF